MRMPPKVKSLKREHKRLILKLMCAKTDQDRDYILVRVNRNLTKQQRLGYYDSE